MAHLIGTTYTDRFTLIDSEGAYVEGETFTADQSFDPAGASFDWEITELGDGLYELTYTLALAGTYYLRLVTETLSPFQVYESSVVTDELEAGATATHYFTVRDAAGDFYGGSPIAVDATYDPAGDIIVPIITDLENGLYRVTWPLPDPGTYTVRLIASLPDTGDEDQVFEFESRVLEATEDEVNPFAAVTGATLDDLIRSVARKCRDYLETKATENASDGSAWIERRRLGARSPKALKGSELFVTSAAISDNTGYAVGVLDSVSGALTLDPALPAASRANDTGYIVNLASEGFHRDTYKQVIVDTIGDAFPNMLQPASWTFTDSFDGDYPYLTPPDAFTHIYDLIIPSEGWYGGETHIPQGTPERPGWYWDGSRIVIAGECYREFASGTYLTILGYGAWPDLVNDTDKTGIDRQWLTEQAAGMLILSLRDPKRQAEAAMHLNRADGYLPKAITMVAPNTIRIR